MPKSYSITDIGKKRKLNQDYVFSSDVPVGNLPNLYIVADGMGGHKAGDRASRFTVESMTEYIRNAGEKDPAELFVRVLKQVNRDLRKLAGTRDEYEGMGTTVVAACVVGDRLYAANVGDSRLYLLDRELHQVTVDHSLVEEMVLAGSLDQREARNHPDKNIITRAVGVDGDLQVDLFSEKLEAGNGILMCTDGLTNMVDDEEISRILQKSEITDREKTVILTETANENGGKDNITVLFVRI